MSAENEPKKRGPKGGMKHTPGRGHTPKSGPQKKKRFQRRAAKLRQTFDHQRDEAWALWDSLPPEVRALRPELKPTFPRPDDER